MVSAIEPVIGSVVYSIIAPIYDTLKKENPTPLKVGDVVKHNPDFQYQWAHITYGKVISPETYQERTGHLPSRSKAIKKGNIVCLELNGGYDVVPTNVIIKIDPADEITRIGISVEDKIAELEAERDSDLSFLESVR